MNIDNDDADNIDDIDKPTSDNINKPSRLGSGNFLTSLCLYLSLVLQSKGHAKSLFEQDKSIKLSAEHWLPSNKANEVSWDESLHSDYQDNDFISTSINNHLICSSAAQTEDDSLITESIQTLSTVIDMESAPLINLGINIQNTIPLRNTADFDEESPSDGKSIFIELDSHLKDNARSDKSTEANGISVTLSEHLSKNMSPSDKSANLLLSNDIKNSHEETILNEIMHPLIADQVTQTLLLIEGWNLISFYVEADDMSPAAVLESIYDEFLTIKNINSSHHKNHPDFLNTITELNVNHGYWVYMNAAASLELTGHIPKDKEISYIQGWNLVSCPSHKPLSIDEYLNFFENNDTINTIKDVQDVFDTNNPPFLNTLTNMEPGKGYWVNTSQAVSVKIGDDLQDIVINEVMSSNGNTVADMYGNYYDFIELYNKNNTSIDISGFGLTDNPGRLGKFTFPDGTEIDANDFVLVYASKGEGLPDANDTMKFEYWDNVPGASINDLIAMTNSTDYQNGNADEIQYINSFDTTKADGFQGDGNEDFGGRLSGVVTAPETGTYTFSLVSDDASVLVISADDIRHDYALINGGISTDNEKMTVIARETAWTNVNNWGKIKGSHDLIKGEKYYIEGIYKEAFGGDHLQVGWVLPSDNKSAATEAIPGEYFEKREIEISNQTYYADFAIANDNESITLTDKNGDVIDLMPAMLIKPGMSYGSHPDGSENRYFFEKPTPLAGNLDGKPEICPEITWDNPQGFYNQPTQVQLSIDSEDASHDDYSIYYTLDGSSPNMDNVGAEDLYWHTLIDKGDIHRYMPYKASSAEFNKSISSNWNTLSFDDSTWLQGPSGFGYSDNDDATILTTGVGTATVSARKRFTLDADLLDDIDKVKLHMHFDDGFVAYLNGIEIARANVNSTNHNSFATAVVGEATSVTVQKPFLFDVDEDIINEALRSGENIFSIRCFNASNTSSDMSCSPLMSIGMSEKNNELPGLSSSLSLSDFSDSSTTYSYRDTIPINITTIVRAIAVPTDEANCITESTYPDTKTFIIDTEEHYSQSPLPVISIVAERYPEIEADYRANIEIPASVTFFDPDGEEGFSQYAGMKIVGGYLRVNAQKSLGLYARSMYGESEFDYKLFPELKNDIGEPIETFEAFVLRNSGNDWTGSSGGGGSSVGNRTHFRDGLMTSLVKDTGIDITAFRPASVMINGEYWGILNIREKFNEHSLADHHAGKGVSADHMDRIEIAGHSFLSPGIIQDAGQASQFAEMMNMLNGNTSQSNLRVDNNYREIANQLDVHNHMLWHITQIFINNLDSPNNNNKFFRPYTEDENGNWVPDKWMTQLYDTDWGWDLIKVSGTNWSGNMNIDAYKYDALSFYASTTQIIFSNPPSSTLLFRKLLQNQEYQDQFVSHFTYYLNTLFEPSQTLALISDLSGVTIDFNGASITPSDGSEPINDEISYHTERWGGSPTTWENNIHNVIVPFAIERPEYVFEFIKDYFNLDDYVSFSLTNTNPDFGTLYAATYLKQAIPDNWKNKKFFEDVPFEIKAVAKPGYEVIWEAPNNIDMEFADDDQSHVKITIKGDNTVLNVRFEENISESPVTINEVMADNEDTQFYTNVDGEKIFSDWIEILNPTTQSINLTGYFLMDSANNQWNFPDNATIDANEYLIVWADGGAGADSNIDADALHATFRLSATDGDAVLFYDADRAIIDELSFEALATNQSFGRKPDGSENKHVLTPSPGGSNDEAEIILVADPEENLFIDDLGF